MSRHFKDYETKCRCGCGLDLFESFKAQLDTFRDAMDFPMSLTSGARCEEHNRVEKGSEQSYHVKCRAADISWEHFSGATKAKMLAYAMQNFGGIGLHKSFLHVDNRDLKIVWFY